MRRCLLPLACLGIAVTAGTAVAQSGQEPPPMDPVTARCVLDNLRFAEGRAAVELIHDACASLAAQSPGDGTGYLVRCKVAADPDWIEFRLVTRRQCDDASGKALPPGD
jgi:hypothetical protein